MSTPIDKDFIANLKKAILDIVPDRYTIDVEDSVFHWGGSIPGISKIATKNTCLKISHRCNPPNRTFLNIKAYSNDQLFEGDIEITHVARIAVESVYVVDISSLPKKDQSMAVERMLFILNWKNPIFKAVGNPQTFRYETIPGGDCLSDRIQIVGNLTIDVIDCGTVNDFAETVTRFMEDSYIATELFNRRNNNRVLDKDKRNV